MERFIQVSVDGIAAGSVYGAVALALVLIFRSTGIVNFAQGEMAMFSTFIAWQFTQSGVSIALAVLATLVISFVGGMLIERILIRPVEGGEVLTLVIVTLGLFIMINGLAAVIWDPNTRAFPSLFPRGAVDVAGVRFGADAIGITLLALAVVGVIYLIFQKTKIGLAIRAAAVNPESSRLVGVPVGRTLMIGWGLAAAVGALAGALIAPRLFLDVNFMSSVLIYSFAAATLGGFDSALGAMVGGWVIGLSENLAGAYVEFIGSELKILVPLAIILGVLLVRPTGLFGSAEVARA